MKKIILLSLTLAVFALLTSTVFAANNLKTPLASRKRGTYYFPFQVTIDAVYGGPEVYYTLDGSTPSKKNINAKLWDGHAIDIYKSTKLKVVAIDGNNRSMVRIYKYIFNENYNNYTEVESYKNIKQITKRPVYKPTYTAGYSYDSIRYKDGEYHNTPQIVSENTVWYKKIDSNFHIINGVKSDSDYMFIGGHRTIPRTFMLGSETLKAGDKTFSYYYGRFATWQENGYVYGIETNGGLSKEEIIKIIESMKLVE